MSVFCSAFSAGASSRRFVILKPAHHGVEVGFLAEEIRIDRGGCQRIGALQPDAAAAFGPQQADVAGEAGAPARLAAVVVDHRHAEMQLDVGHIELGPAS